MPDIPKPVAILPLPGVQCGSPIAGTAEAEESLMRELTKLTPANEKLLALAEKAAPPPEWLDEEEDVPF